MIINANKLRGGHMFRTFTHYESFFLCVVLDIACSLSLSFFKTCTLINLIKIKRSESGWPLSLLKQFEKL